MKMDGERMVGCMNCSNNELFLCRYCLMFVACKLRIHVKGVVSRIPPGGNSKTPVLEN